MSEIFAYLSLGYQHITDIYGFDHILFIGSLCAIYSLINWKDVLILVTAFTIGHSITLALATLNLVSVNSELVEVAIPITIIITCLFNFFHRFPKSIYTKVKNNTWSRYIMALGFGLIHGLGFSNYLRSLLGAEASIFSPLLSFNIGLEVGQLFIVAIFLGVNFFLTEIAGYRRQNWNLILSGIIMGMTLMLLMDRIKLFLS